MDAETISHVTQSFHQIFSHIPYAVYGLSALAQHGYTRRLPRTVHVLCPEHTRQTILHWAAIKQLTRLSPVQDGRDHWGEDDNGYSVYSTEFHGGGNIEEDDLVLAVAIPDGSLRRVRIVFEDQNEFSRLPKEPAPTPTQLTTIPCPPAATSSQVLSLPAIVTRVVLAYHKSFTEGASINTQEVMADGLVWVLYRIINSTPNNKAKFDGTWKTNLSSGLFLVPFTESFPRAKPLLEQAGIEIPNIDQLDK
ncbi:unnamed protein product [Clonostachys chloroleuca]|uniref:Uncharacterized protein n=1 Tax=Clonostachys chloroleuca TaxID=1926264 RepID=A0AA35LVF3_9HYPO|nr:unnamed protein product [Clonostachys chloroleuca]